VTIPAGSEIPFNFTGDFVALIAQTGSSDIKLGIGDNPPQDFEKGLSYKMPPGTFYDLFRIKNGGGTDATITIAYGFGEFSDGRLVVTGGVAISSPTAFVSAADQSVPSGAATLICAANANRRQAIIQNLDGSNSIRVGDASVTATRGTLVAAGATFVLDVSAALYAYQASGGAVSVAVQELE
jgi:hypothetical protein